MRMAQSIVFITEMPLSLEDSDFSECSFFAVNV